MRAKVITIAGICLLTVCAAIAAEQASQQAAQPTQQAAGQGTGGIVEVAYVLTWEKDPRYRARDPFLTVLHSMGGPAGVRVQRMALPRTPGEETAFAEKAAAMLEEAQAAMNESDYKAAGEKIELLREMVTVPMVTQTAKDKMATVSSALAKVEQQYGQMRARAALAEALQIAARMQAYFDTERYGEVVDADTALQALNEPAGLQNAEVAATGAEVLARCAEIKRRAVIHLEFNKKGMLVDAISYFPMGRSYAIVNGEVFEEGAELEPELTLAAVAGEAVTFKYKGEDISAGLAAPQEIRPQVNAARRVK